MGAAQVPDAVKIKGQQLPIEKISEGHGILWGMAFLPGKDSVLLTEKSGKMVLLNLTSRKKTEIQGVPPVEVHGQGGLLDVRLHPNFSDNSLVYWTYAVKVDGGFNTRLARGKLTGSKLTDVQVLFTGQPGYRKGQHFGSRIAFKDGHVFFTIGDRGERDEAQKLSTHTGKVLRLLEDGKVPKDNPFVGVKDARPEIWSYGHRNPQGLYVHPDTGELWLHEHGPRGGDEINRVLKGRNYGWPLVTFGKEYFGPRIGKEPPVEGMESPKKQYTPSIAPCGFVIVSGREEGPFQGAFVLGSLVLTHINVVWPEGEDFSSEVRLLESAKERIRNVDYHAGYLYFSTDSGGLYRIASKGS